MSLVELIDFLKTNNTVTSLDDQGARHLANLLKVNTTLTSLEIHNNRISATGVEYISEALKENTSLISLNLYGNFISVSGADYISQALKVNTSLTSLELTCYNYCDLGAKSSSEALDKNVTLRFLYFNWDYIPKKIFKDVTSKIERNNKLQTNRIRLFKEAIIVFSQAYYLPKELYKYILIIYGREISGISQPEISRRIDRIFL